MESTNEHLFSLNNEEYHLTWIDKPRITKKGIEQKALPILRDYINSENLPIQLVNKNGNNEVTYTLARKVLEFFLAKKEKDVKKSLISKVIIDKNGKSKNNLSLDKKKSVDQKINLLLNKLDWVKIKNKNRKKLLIIGCSHSKNIGGIVNLEQDFFAQQNELIFNRNLRFDTYSNLLLNYPDYFGERIDYFNEQNNNHLFMPAIERYNGRFYSEALRQLYLEKNQNSNLHILIISGLYGVIEFRDSIIDYHFEISKNPFWTQQNNMIIQNIINNYILENNIEHELVFYSLPQAGIHSYINALKPFEDWKSLWIIDGGLNSLNTSAAALHEFLIRI